MADTVTAPQNKKENMEKITLSGNLKLVLQWDLDHHEATLHINGESLTYELLKTLLPKYVESESANEIELGKFNVEFSKLLDG